MFIVVLKAGKGEAAGWVRVAGGWIWVRLRTGSDPVKLLGSDWFGSVRRKKVSEGGMTSHFPQSSPPRSAGLESQPELQNRTRGSNGTRRSRCRRGFYWTLPVRVGLGSGSQLVLRFGPGLNAELETFWWVFFFFPVAPGACMCAGSVRTRAGKVRNPVSARVLFAVFKIFLLNFLFLL